MELEILFPMAKSKFSLVKRDAIPKYWSKSIENGRQKDFQSVVLDYFKIMLTIFYVEFRENFWLLLSIQSFVFSEYLEVFEYFGQDKNGRISTQQLRQAMRMVGLNPTDHQIQALINEKECDGKKFTTVMNVLFLPTVPVQCAQWTRTESKFSKHDKRN